MTDDVAEKASPAIDVDVLKRLIRSSENNNGHKEWNAWRAQNRDYIINLHSVDLRNADLSGAHLYSVDLRRSDLSDADLSGANLSEANLEGVNLSNTNLTHANLVRACLNEAKLFLANLSGANLSKVYCRRANLSGANLTKVDLSRATLDYTDFSEASLSEANLSETYSERAKFRGADLGAANLSEADLCVANFRGANLGATNLRGAKLCFANLSEAYICFARLDGADLTGAVLMRTQCENWSIEDVICEYAYFELPIKETKYFEDGEFEDYIKEYISELKKMEVKVDDEQQYNGSLSNFDYITPDNVAMIVSIVGAAIGVTTVGIKGIQLWIDDRKSRKIKIKVKDTEMEISGALSEQEIEDKIRIFHKFRTGIIKEEVEITIEGIYDIVELSIMHEFVSEILSLKEELKHGTTISDSDLSEIIGFSAKLKIQLEQSTTDHLIIQSLVKALAASLEKAVITNNISSSSLLSIDFYTLKLLARKS